jgi:hypothetical protein
MRRGRSSSASPPNWAALRRRSSRPCDVVRGRQRGLVLEVLVLLGDLEHALLAGRRGRLGLHPDHVGEVDLDRGVSCDCAWARADVVVVEVVVVVVDRGGLRRLARGPWPAGAARRAWPRAWLGAAACLRGPRWRPRAWPRLGLGLASAAWLVLALTSAWRLARASRHLVGLGGGLAGLGLGLGGLGLWAWRRPWHGLGLGGDLGLVWRRPWRLALAAGLGDGLAAALALAGLLWPRGCACGLAHGLAGGLLGGGFGSR